MNTILNPKYPVLNTDFWFFLDTALAEEKSKGISGERHSHKILRKFNLFGSLIPSTSENSRQDVCILLGMH